MTQFQARNSACTLLITLLSLVALLLISIPVLAKANDSTLPVQADIYTTLPSTLAHNPVRAIDGDPATYFRSVYGMDDGDDFLVMLARPIPVDAITITTGTPDGKDLLSNAMLETSDDDPDYHQIATFGADGIAHADLKGALVKDIRIRMQSGQNAAVLVIREIAVDSPVKIGYVELAPGKGFLDVSKAPDVLDWALRAQKQVAEFWPAANAMLYTDNFVPPNMVNMVFADGDGVAATGGGVMTVNAKWCRAHADDTGLTVHEMAHVVQAYPTYDAGWLVEGIADYVRWVKFEPEHFHPGINPEKSTWHDAYQTTAAWLGYVADHYDPCIVTKLNAALRNGTYSDDIFTKDTGKTPDQLWQEFVSAYQAQNANLPSGIRPTAPQ